MKTITLKGKEVDVDVFGYVSIMGLWEVLGRTQDNHPARFLDSTGCQKKEVELTKARVGPYCFREKDIFVHGKIARLYMAKHAQRSLYVSYNRALRELEGKQGERQG